MNRWNLGESSDLLISTEFSFSNMLNLTGQSFGLMFNYHELQLRFPFAKEKKTLLADQLCKHKWLDKVKVGRK
jgi:hypothetical protein